MASPRFTFFQDDARKHMADVLSTYSAQKGDPIAFNASGVNTLFPLVAGFGLLASYLEKEASDAAQHLRDESEFPVVFRESTLVDFGYRYRLPFLNFTAEARERLLVVLRSVSRELSNSQTPGVRNSLEHHKGEFPASASIIACTDAILRVCDMVEEFGILPLMFKLKSYTRDSEGRAQYVYEDYSKRGVKVTAPSTVVVTGAPGITQNQIIVPGVISGGSGWVPRFNPGIRSDYTAMWHSWPRSRAFSGNFVEAPGVLEDSGEVRTSLEEPGASVL
jgi:hypothetical protein